MEDLLQRVLGCRLCTVGAHGVCVHSVSWIRHLGMACGEMFVVRCSHNLPATAELPFANRPGDRTDRFRSTCRSSLLVKLTVIFFCSYSWGYFFGGQFSISYLMYLLADVSWDILFVKISKKKSHYTSSECLCAHIIMSISCWYRVNIYRVECMLLFLINMLVDWLLNTLPVLPIIAQLTAYKAYCFTTHTRTHTQTCWHAHLSLGKPPQAVALAQRHSLSWVKMLGAKMHPVKMLRISDARTDKHRRWFEEKWCWSNCSTVDIYYQDGLLVSDNRINSLVCCVTALKTERKYGSLED